MRTAHDWQLHFEEFSELTRPSVRRPFAPPFFDPRAPATTAPFQSFLSFFLCIPSLPPFYLRPLSSAILSLSLSLFWAYGLQLRSGRLGAPFLLHCTLVGVRFCAHLPHSLSFGPLYLAPLRSLPIYRRSAASIYLQTALSPAHHPIPERARSLFPIF